MSDYHLRLTLHGLRINMKYKRVLIKLSGEMLGNRRGGFSMRNALEAAKEINSIVSQGLEVAVLVGGGNIMRAREAVNISRLTADFMGMTATVINSLGLKDALNQVGIEASILSAVKVAGITEELVVERADSYLKNGKLVIFAGGTGAPFFTTDTAAALRALEIRADVLLKATNVDGVYSSDPGKNKTAKLYQGRISFKQTIKKNLKIMDTAAFSILSENNLSVIVFNFKKKGNLKRIINGDPIGTIISNKC